MRNKLLYSILFLLMVFSYKSFAQETLSGLQTNHLVEKLHKERLKNKSTLKSKAVLELPFIDDFAKSIGLPDSSLWIDENAFINQTYSINAPSIGVATLDAISNLGTIYSTASSLPFSADTLTSKQINLNYPGNNTIFLSFYYQPGGLGDNPELNDTLIVEYYSIDSTRWESIWKANYNKQDSILIETNVLTDTRDTIYGSETLNLEENFYQVILPVNQDQFLKSGFQFRFRNYASLSSTEGNESRASNSDHWHLDFIILDKDRNENDSIIDDLTINKPQTSMLKNFDAIPWHHYPLALTQEMKREFYMENRNLNDTKISPTRNYRVRNLLGLTEDDEFTSVSTNPVLPFSTNYHIYPTDYAFLYNPDFDSLIFLISSYTNSDVFPETEPYRWNDTTHFYQKFYNYYAYDDGTAENGYGLIGEGTEQAKVAMRFISYIEDTLTGIQIYFNQTLNNANQYTYKVHVWDEVDGKPGSEIYTLENQKPENTDELNKFTIIPFDEKIVVSDAFYIGWQKEYSTEMLNVGFDVNRINNDKLYYNFNGEWKQSDYEGTVMIRPMFGEKVELVTSNNPISSNKFDFEIYPNPAKETIHINFDFTEDYNYTVYDSYGRQLKSGVSSQNSINISDLNSGMYILKIESTNNTSATRKFIVLP